MKAIVIQIPDDIEPALESNWVKHVAQQLEDGFTSGHVDAEHHWSIEEVE